MQVSRSREYIDLIRVKRKEKMVSGECKRYTYYPASIRSAYKSKRRKEQ